MPTPVLEVEWFELYKVSRKTRITATTISKDVSFILCGNFEEMADSNDFGLNDDVIVIKEVVKKFFPTVFLQPLCGIEPLAVTPGPEIQIPYYPDGFTALLYLSSITVEQQSYNTWKVDVLYDIPEDGGNSSGNGNANSGAQEGEGPDGEGWVEQYTQLGFDISMGSRIIKESISLLSCQVRTGLTMAAPYTQSKPAPLGLTNDDYTGIEVPEAIFRFSITVFVPPAFLKYRYARRLGQLIGRINSAVFFGFPKGSVMITGASVKGNLYQTVPLDLSFEYKPNFKFSSSTEVLSDPDNDDVEAMFDTYKDPDFPDTVDFANIDGGAYPGFSHVEYLYTKEPSADNKAMILKPYCRMIHGTILFGDFDKLGI